MVPWIEAIDCSIEPASDLPDYTLNGILPGNTAANNVAEFNGMLPVKGGVLLHGSTGVFDIAQQDQNLSYESDGTSLYRLKQDCGQHCATGSPAFYQLCNQNQQIDTATGLVTNINGCKFRC